MEHYLQVTEADFAKAAGRADDKTGKTPDGETPVVGSNRDPRKEVQNPAHNTVQDKGTNLKGPEQDHEILGNYDNRRASVVPKAPPVGDEHPPESSGKSDVASCGAAESAAVDADPRLAALITAWPTLSESDRRVIEETIGTAKE